MCRALNCKTVRGRINIVLLMTLLWYFYQTVQTLCQGQQFIWHNWRKTIWLTIVIVIPSSFLGTIIIVLYRRNKGIIFPIACGHRRCIFTGKSSRSLQDILLTIDTEIQTEEEFREAEHKAIQCLDDLKTELERKIMPLECILAGSVAERYGIPYAYMKSKIPAFISALKTDFDIMLCFQSIEASFDGRTGVIIQPLTHNSGFIGYVQLKSMATNSVICSKDIMKQAKRAVGDMKVANLALPKMCWTKVNMKIKGPAIKINVPQRYEADITMCIKCCEWPPLSDWPTRQRCWPSPQDVRRIVSLGCHLVPKPEPSDKQQTSWRFSFSVAEIELSKLVPTTARKCFLALRIVLKDHLKPVYHMTSYEIKTILLNTLERTPTNLWVDEKIEQCFFILLKEIYDALFHGRLLHHWFCDVNLFFKFYSPRAIKSLLKKLRRIGENPAPFIFNDGCCCVSPYCTRLHLYNFPIQAGTNSYVEVVVNEQVDDKTDQVGCYDNPSALTVEQPTSSSSSANHREPSQGSVQSVVVTVHSPGRQPTYDDDDRQPTYDDDDRQPTYDHDERQPTYDHDERQPTYDHDDRQPTYDVDDRQPTHDHDERQPTYKDDESQPTYDDDERQPMLNPRACHLSKYGAITL